MSATIKLSFDSKIARSHSFFGSVHIINENTNEGALLLADSSIHFQAQSIFVAPFNKQHQSYTHYDFQWWRCWCNEFYANKLKQYHRRCVYLFSHQFSIELNFHLNEQFQIRKRYGFESRKFSKHSKHFLCRDRKKKNKNFVKKFILFEFFIKIFIQMTILNGSNWY